VPLGDVVGGVIHPHASPQREVWRATNLVIKLLGLPSANHRGNVLDPREFYIYPPESQSRFLIALPETASNYFHKALAATSGAVGGSFGLAALPIELPISTVIMLRSIGDVARAEGEDLRDPETTLSCLQVFALGGLKGDADAANSVTSRCVVCWLNQLLRRRASLLIAASWPKAGRCWCGS
jgi:hypothetical protein